MTDLCGAQAGEVYPYLARLRDLSLNPEMEEQIKNLVPEALQSRVRRAFRDLVYAFSQKQPVVLVWEDLHWADPSSLGLLETLFPLCEEMPVLLLLIFRPDEGVVEEWHQRVRSALGDEKYQVIKLAR